MKYASHSIIILVLVITSLSYVSIAQEKIPGDAERWDLRMIKEAKIWDKLTTNILYADRQKYWPERKAALESVVRDYPDSRWADDAALILACGRADFDNDIDGAITDLQKVAAEYPDGKTMVTSWIPGGDFPCEFDQTWTSSTGWLVFLNQDGSTRIAKPFDREGTIPQLYKERLAYFNHLEKYPRRTNVMARIFISKLLVRKGDSAQATMVLKDVVLKSKDLAKTIAADSKAASGTCGYHIRNLRRPEYNAYFLLAHLYKKQKDKPKAIAKDS